jgi:hypothetical protein
VTYPLAFAVLVLLMFRLLLPLLLLLLLQAPLQGQASPQVGVTHPQALTVLLLPPLLLLLLQAPPQAPALSRAGVTHHQALTRQACRALCPALTQHLASTQETWAALNHT